MARTTTRWLKWLKWLKQEAKECHDLARQLLQYITVYWSKFVSNVFSSCRQVESCCWQDHSDVDWNRRWTSAASLRFECSKVIGTCAPVRGLMLQNGACRLTADQHPQPKSLSQGLLWKQSTMLQSQLILAAILSQNIPEHWEVGICCCQQTARLPYLECPQTEGNRSMHWSVTSIQEQVLEVGGVHFMVPLHLFALTNTPHCYKVSALALALVFPASNGQSIRRAAFHPRMRGLNRVGKRADKFVEDLPLEQSAGCEVWHDDIGTLGISS